MPWRPWNRPFVEKPGAQAITAPRQPLERSEITSGSSRSEAAFLGPFRSTELNRRLSATTAELLATDLLQSPNPGAAAPEQAGVSEVGNEAASSRIGMTVPDQGKCCRPGAAARPGGAHPGRPLHVLLIVSSHRPAGVGIPVERGTIRRPKSCAKRETPNSGGWSEGPLHPDVQNPNLTLPTGRWWAKAELPCLIRLCPMIWRIFRNGAECAPRQQALARAIPACHPWWFRDWRSSNEPPERTLSVCFSQNASHPALINQARGSPSSVTPIGDSRGLKPPPQFPPPPQLDPPPSAHEHHPSRPLKPEGPYLGNRAATSLGGRKGRSAG